MKIKKVTLFPVPSPTINMGAVRLGYWLCELSRQIVVLTERLFSIEPEKAELDYFKDEDALMTLISSGDYLVRMRTLLIRYATLMTAVQRPELPCQTQQDDKCYDDRHLSNLHTPTTTTAAHWASRIQSLCRDLIESDDENVLNIQDNLDFACSAHGYLCGFQFQKIQERYKHLEDPSSEA